MVGKEKKTGPTTRAASVEVEHKSDDVLVESMSMTAQEDFGLPTRDDFATLQCEMHSNFDCHTSTVVA